MSPCFIITDSHGVMIYDAHSFKLADPDGEAIDEFNKTSIVVFHFLFSISVANKHLPEIGLVMVLQKGKAPPWLHPCVH